MTSVHAQVCALKICACGLIIGTLSTRRSWYHGSIFAAWQPLRMSRRSWNAVTDFKTRVLRLKPEVQILGSSESIRHTKVKILRLKSSFLRKKETQLHANLWKTFSNELFCRRSWWFHVGLLNDLRSACKPRLWSSSARPAMPFVNQERLVLKFPSLLTVPIPFRHYLSVISKNWSSLFR